MYCPFCFQTPAIMVPPINLHEQAIIKRAVLSLLNEDFLNGNNRNIKVKMMDEVDNRKDKRKQKNDEQKKGDSSSQEIRDYDIELLSRMAKSAVPIVKNIGINMLRKGKQDTKGELYDPAYFPGKMIILGKAVQPVSFRPDNPQMPVTDQFCVLSEEGKFFELMYSFDGFLTDSYLNPLDEKTALEHYGYDIIFMLLEILEKIIGNIFTQKS